MITLLYGVPGSGKSTLAHDLVKAQASTHRFFICDHEAGWGDDGPLWRGQAPGLNMVQGADELSKLRSFDDAGVWVFRNCEPRDVAQLCVDVGNTTYVDDEIDRAGRRKEFDDSALRTIVNEGRHVPNSCGEICTVNIIGACRRPQKLHNDLSDLADQVFVFRCQGSRTLGRLKDDSMIEDSDWSTISELVNFAFLHWPSGRYLTIPAL